MMTLEVLPTQSSEELNGGDCVSKQAQRMSGFWMLLELSCPLIIFFFNKKWQKWTEASIFIKSFAIVLIVPLSLGEITDVDMAQQN